MTASLIYKGNLRCEVAHANSGTVIEIDAPLDNRGKGKRFSPTDMLCVALATCAITTMALKARDNMGTDLEGAESQIMKTMASNPRRIAKVEVSFTLPSVNLTEEQRQDLQHTGDNCPVAKSIGSDTEVVITYNWR